MQGSVRIIGIDGIVIADTTRNAQVLGIGGIQDIAILVQHQESQAALALKRI